VIRELKASAFVDVFNSLGPSQIFPYDLQPEEIAADVRACRIDRTAA
jgi:hypothetical protein